MKKLILPIIMLLSFPTFAQDIQLRDLSKDDVEDVSKEFGANFAHTTVAAPETNGLWGIEVGVIAGTSQSPNFSDVVDASGGDGDDFKRVYHAGLMARVHFPLEIFVEATVLPEREIEDVKIKSNSFGIGWNAGAFFNLPLDIAVGIDRGNGEINFSQEAQGSDPATDITLETQTTNMWIGVSKTFLIVTPYIKYGQSKIDADLKADASIFGFTASRSQSVDTNGSYLAVGANLELGFLKLGLEGSQIQQVRRTSVKLSLDF